MDSSHKQAIAERLRAVLGPGPTEELAKRLDIGVSSLRVALDEKAPEPRADVIAAVASKLGIDPTWILLGRYDAAVHRRATETPADAAQAVDALLHRPDVVKELG